jgi:hypothetical protein
MNSAMLSMLFQHSHTNDDYVTQTRAGQVKQIKPKHDSLVVVETVVAVIKVVAAIDPRVAPSQALPAVTIPFGVLDVNKKDTVSTSVRRLPKPIANVSMRDSESNAYVAHRIRTVLELTLRHPLAILPLRVRIPVFRLRHHNGNKQAPTVLTLAVLLMSKMPMPLPLLPVRRAPSYILVT